MCNQCGERVINGKNKKYCDDCATAIKKEKVRQLAKENMRKKRKQC